MQIIVFKGVLRSWASDYKNNDLNFTANFYFSNFCNFVISEIVTRA